MCRSEWEDYCTYINEKGEEKEEYEQFLVFDRKKFKLIRRNGLFYYDGKKKEIIKKEEKEEEKRILIHSKKYFKMTKHNKKWFYGK